MGKTSSANRSELIYWAWFSSLVNITPRRRMRLLEYFGDPAFLWECPEEELKKLRSCSPKIIEAITDKKCRAAAKGILDAVQKCDATVITIKDELYPELLKNIPDPPSVLYCRGTLVKGELCMAVVGSRKATAYGLDMAFRLSRDMSAKGVTVVSGMARGIDSKAHAGALEAGGRTIAVLGCGVDIAYPGENAKLMEQILHSGAVISEYLPGTEPVSYNFPQRNRIISGLSQGVAIVEASEKSGSLITADFALEQGREVYAVPGNITNRNSMGTNRLIRDGAKLVTSAADILEELKINHEACDYITRIKQNRCISLGKEELTISERLLDGPAHIDMIARDCGISVQLAGSVLIMLELSGFVEQLPGKFYRLIE